jgi:hypothetical protein
MAMRVSLGAGRLRLVRQLLTESLLIFAQAGALGEKRWALARAAGLALVVASRPKTTLSGSHWRWIPAFSFSAPASRPSPPSFSEWPPGKPPARNQCRSLSVSARTFDSFNTFQNHSGYTRPADYCSKPRRRLDSDFCFSESTLEKALISGTPLGTIYGVGVRYDFESAK